MRDFDRERPPVKPLSERQFTLRGRAFTVRERVRPEAQAILEDSIMRASALDVLDDYDKAFLMYLVPDDADKWREVRALDGDDVLQYAEINAIMKFLIEATSDRPTTAPSGSTDGRATTADTSEASSSPQGATPTT